jgi:hypothetical protein
VFDYTYHDNETMNKVYKGLKRANVPNDLIADAVNCIMNEGIVFREVKPSGPVIVNSDDEIAEIGRKENKLPIWNW